MASRLWFLTDGVQLLDIFSNKNEVVNEYNKYQDDPDFNYYDYYGVEIDLLEEYPQEYDLALEKGFI